MSVKKQVFWLRGQSILPALPIPLGGISGLAGISSLVTAALPRGILTRFPILPSSCFGALCSHLPTSNRWVVQRTAQLVAVRRQVRQARLFKRFFADLRGFPGNSYGDPPSRTPLFASSTLTGQAKAPLSWCRTPFWACGWLEDGLLVRSGYGVVPMGVGPHGNHTMAAPCRHRIPKPRVPGSAGN